MKIILGLIYALISLPAFALAPVQEITSKSGIKAWLIEDHSNPIIAIQFSFRGGAALDPVGKEGLARLAAGTMDEGAGKLDSQAFQSKLQENSITLRFEAQMDSFGGRVLTLSENLPIATELLKAALIEPRFDQEPVNRIRQQILTDLKQSEEDPGSVGALAMFKSIFKDHPYARGSKGTIEAISSIQSDDLKTFVRQRIAKNNLIIGISGDITSAEVSKLLDQVFGELPKTASPWDLPKPTLTFDGTLDVIEKPIPQSNLMFAQAGIDRNHPDFYPTYVLNYILGGGGFAWKLTDFYNCIGYWESFKVWNYRLLCL